MDNMSNGVMVITAGGSGQPVQYPPGVAPWGWPVSGLLVGMVCASNGGDDTNAESRARGTINLQGGTITNNYHLILGANGGTGTVIQSGGNMIHRPVDTNRITIIGYGYGTNSYSGAGHGTYEMSAGTFATPARVFVGGVSTNIQWYAKPGAVGMLKVAGGSFTCSNTVYVGDNGIGMLVIGANGTVTVGNLEVTNATSTMRFEFGPEGIGTLVVTNELRVSSASKLEVNLGPYPGTGLIKLLDCKTRSGAFAATNITIVGAGALVDQTLDEDIYVRIASGTLILIR